MATYKYAQYIQQSNSNAFDQEHPPGAVPPFSGIYRCINCGREIVAEQERTFPPQNHHQHVPPSPIRWRLIVWADHNPK